MQRKFTEAKIFQKNLHLKSGSGRLFQKNAVYSYKYIREIHLIMCAIAGLLE